MRCSIHIFNISASNQLHPEHYVNIEVSGTPKHPNSIWHNPRQHLSHLTSLINLHIDPILWQQTAVISLYWEAYEARHETNVFWQQCFQCVFYSTFFTDFRNSIFLKLRKLRIYWFDSNEFRGRQNSKWCGSMMKVPEITEMWWVFARLCTKIPTSVIWQKQKKTLRIFSSFSNYGILCFYVCNWKTLRHFAISIL